MEITRDLYRLALHFYLIVAFPDDDVEYYSKWAWLVGPNPTRFWQRGYHSLGEPEKFDFPREVRFGSHHNPHMKLRCYVGGFMVDTNVGDDPPKSVIESRRIKAEIERLWIEHGIPIHGKPSKGENGKSI